MSPERDEVSVVIASPGDDIEGVLHSPNKRRKVRNAPQKRRRRPIPKKAEPRPKKRKVTPSKRTPTDVAQTPGTPVREQASLVGRIPPPPHVAAPTPGTPKKLDSPSVVLPAMGKVDSAFATMSFAFSRANQKRMRERVLHMKNVSDGTTTIEKIPEEYRADVQEEIRNEQRRLAQNYHANTIIAIVLRCETKLQ